jgi:hypothetical protein
MRCCSRREMQQPYRETVKDKHAIRGKCGVCGSNMFKFSGSASKNRPKGWYDARKREKRNRLAREKLLENAPKIVACFQSDEPQ